MLDDVFKYMDTASTHYDIVAVSEKLALHAIAIVGLGGTGSYILDLVAKTYVKSIHLYDDDQFEIRNAFRSPGAASQETLAKKPSKAEHFREVYSVMRNNIFAHGNINELTIQELRNMNFVFLAAELGHLRKFVAEKLEHYGVPFIDVGMEVNKSDDTLHGVLRVTTSVEKSRALANSRLPAPREIDEDKYSERIQIADLNALNAALAVIKWKKILGFYYDHENEYNSRYLINNNRMLNQDHA